MLFVTEYKDVASLKERLSKTGASTRKWLAEYLDPTTGEKRIEVNQDVDGRLPSILRRTNLPNDLGNLLDEALSSDRVDDWYGLAMYFNQDGVNADELLAVLETRRNAWRQQALNTFGSNFRCPDNRQVVGMTIDEVGDSYLKLLNVRGRIEELTTSRNQSTDPTP